MRGTKYWYEGCVGCRAWGNFPQHEYFTLEISMFKKFVLRLVLPLGLAMASASSWAIVIVGGPNDGVNVGVLDTLLGQQFHTGPGGNPAGEEAWAEGILGFDLSFDGKDETINIYNTDTTGVRAFGLSFAPGYFVLKNSTYRALFANLGSADWGVIDTSLLNSGFNLNGTTISHATQFNDPRDPGPDPVPNPVPVPVPGTALLLGLAVMGLRFGRTRTRGI
jgi:hypothetical protein